MRKRWRVESAMREEMAALAESRTRKIMIAGSLLCFGMPFAGWAGIDFLEEHYGPGTLSATAAMLVLIPAAIGSLIAFFGRLVPAESWDAREWGFVWPSKCFFIGWAPYLPLAVAVPYILPVVLVAWLLLLAGAYVSATIYKLAGRRGR